MGLFSRRKKSGSEPLPNARQEWKDEIPWGTPYSGRDLSLPVPLEVESAPVLAQWFVDVFADEDDVEFDYSIRSLADVDIVLSNFEERGSERTAEVTAAAGFYAGEVFVRNHGFQWVISEFPGFEVPLAMKFGIARAGGGALNIVNKAFKRVENGEEDSIAFFGNYILASE